MKNKKIRLAIVGVGNCAWSLVQGLHHYRKTGDNESKLGLMTQDVGPYGTDDIEVVAAFDVDSRKVGRPLAEALAEHPNNTIKFSDMPTSDVVVSRGPTLDGLGAQLRVAIQESTARESDVADVMRRSGAQVVISYLPVGSQKASEFYAEQAIKAGCAYVNCIPVFLASDVKWQKRFFEAKLPIIGDDIKSQIGATIVHRVLVNLFQDRGVTIDRMYQLNFGGNNDFLNMLDRDRLQSKKISKTRAVTSQIKSDFEDRNIHVGPSDYVPWLDDRKVAHIRIEGRGFGGAPINLEMRLDVWDSPNSAGVAIDAIRCAQLALDRDHHGPILAPSSYFMKTPPKQYTDEEARDLTVSFIRGS